MSLKTEHVCPPIPTKAFDWVAFDDNNENGPFYWGETEQEAIDQFIEEAE